MQAFFVHHATWSINSVCQFLGSGRFDTDNRSTNLQPVLGGDPSLG